MRCDTILVIDDEPMIRHMITRILERASYAVVSAANGIQGLACFRRERPSLVITDLIMPDREGIETIRLILRDQPGMPIIAISGSGRIGSADFLSMARELGASDILRKPFEPRDLLELVAHHVGATRIADRV
ncbi:MAG TPA: response regulator [Stellaceae bacterium]|nr:response regulator [Stellaceae bacterium]